MEQVAKLTPAQLEWYLERCGIMEYEAGLDREAAEQAAWQDLLWSWNVWHAPKHALKLD